jgi:bla regulator protein BlaR1
MLLPEGILDRLTTVQLKGVIAHEVCHVQNRDNLIAALHMLVETIFWFHPLVWWIGKRMVEERERACDEEVLRLSSEPRAYAEGILEICKIYVESPLACVSGVAGANLRKRVEAIMRKRVGAGLSRTKRVVLAVAGAVALTVPVGIGIANAPAIQAQSVVARESKSFEVASVKLLLQPGPGTSTGGGPGTTDPGRFWRSNVTMASLLVQAFQISRACHCRT